MKKATSHQKGVGLIEVLVTVLLLATALLVMAALQVRSLQFNHSSYLRSQANILAYDIIDRMRLNRGDLASYTIDFDSAPPTGTTLAQIDVREWRANLLAVMPNGKGKIQCNISGVCAIGIQWTELNSSGEPTEDSSMFNFSTRI
jgi:type IV pilus assembly protein PilV